jgi:23S rRNA (adenine2030-N6)-methyltransferase
MGSGYFWFDWKASGAMNYRHAYHAGNHADVFKHAALCLLLLALRRKPKPFAVLDTHAGPGLYDLASEEAAKTGEWREGIGRLFGRDLTVAAPYLDLVARLNPEGLKRYPGSPEIVRAFLRDGDRLTVCELHPIDEAELKRNFRRDKRVAVHHRDGYEAIGGLLPPTARRGLVLIDPPFERTDEFERLADALNVGLKKWPTGMFLAWYPIKPRNAGDALRKRYARNNPPTLTQEFLVRRPDGLALAGSGLVIVNPPWQFEATLAALMKELAAALGAPRQPPSDWWIEEK